MHKEKLELKHAEILNEKIRKLGLTISEYSFANLYLFRKIHDYEIIFDDKIFISGITYDNLRFLMPTDDITAMETGYLISLIRKFGALFPIPEEWLHIFDPEEFSFEYFEGDMDYVFTVEKISTYKGKKLHKKRNLLYQFMDLYSHEAFPLTAERRDDARAILNEWQAETGLPEHETDYAECSEAIDYLKDLRLCGGIYYAENQPAGFILGEEINNEMFALHFAKGLTRFKGIYQLMYNRCAQVLHAQYRYLNFEQDLGKLPLRKAKSSYHPDLMIKKYRITLK